MFPTQFPSLRWNPRRYRPGGVGNWSGHTPFACDLVASHKPSVFVELGVYYGESYFAFCQAIAETHASCTAYGIDSWRGDQHIVEYGDEVFAEVSAYNREHYSSFSRLMRTSFDQAAEQFEDGSIDLLHIDGVHTYTGVRHDFEKWFSKVSPGGIILLHDIAVRKEAFEAWRYWAELQEQYRTFAFNHSCGLGVLLKSGREPNGDLANALFGDGQKHTHESIRQYYELCAERLDYKNRFETATRRDQWDLTMQLFWRTTSEEFSESRSRRFFHTLRSAESTIRLAIPKLHHLPCELRLDFSDRPLLVSIQKISILDTKADEVYRLKLDSLPSQPHSSGVQYLELGPADGICVNLISVDPFAVIPLDEQVQKGLSEGGFLEIVMCGLDPATYITDLNSLLIARHSEARRDSIEPFRSDGEPGASTYELDDIRHLAAVRYEQLNAYDQVLLCTERLLSERDQRISGLTSGLQAAQRLVADREQELRRYDKALAEAQQLVAQRDGDITKLASGLQEAQRLATDREQELRRYDKALADAQQFVAQRDGDIAKLASGLQEAQRLATDREQELRRYDKALAEAQQFVAERDGDVTKLTVALQEAQRLAADRDQELRRHGEALAEAQQLIAERDAEVSKLKSRLQEFRCLIEENELALRHSEERVNSRESQINQLQRELAASERELSKYSERLAAIERSWVWRVVRPLTRTADASAGGANR